MFNSLQNQLVLVTGGAKRIGRAIALECARNGASVVITFQHSHEEAKATVEELQRLAPEQRFAAMPLDVSSAREWDELAARVENKFGRVTGLVNNAAIFRRTPLESLTEADFDAHIAANLKGPFLGCQLFGPRMKSAGSGAIVCLSDIYATRPLANYIPYCASKAGSEMLVKGFAKALAPQVRVNGVAPGAILPGEGDEDDAGQLVARVPLKRLGTPEEVARTVVWLLGEASFVSGAIVPVDGGQLLR